MSYLAHLKWYKWFHAIMTTQLAFSRIRSLFDIYIYIYIAPRAHNYINVHIGFIVCLNI